MHCFAVRTASPNSQSPIRIRCSHWRMSPLIPTVPPAQEERAYSIETSVRLIVGNLSEHLLQGFEVRFPDLFRFVFQDSFFRINSASAAAPVAASSRVEPWPLAPGTSGIVATHRPSFSTSVRIVISLEGDSRAVPAGGQAQRLAMEFLLACCLERSINPLVPLHESLAHFAFVGGKKSKDTKAGGNGKPPAFRS